MFYTCLSTKSKPYKGPMELGSSIMFLFDFFYFTSQVNHLGNRVSGSNFGSKSIFIMSSFSLSFVVIDFASILNFISQPIFFL